MDSELLLVDDDVEKVSRFSDNDEERSKALVIINGKNRQIVLLSIDNKLIKRVVVVVFPLVPVNNMDPIVKSSDNSEIASIPAIFENIIPAKLFPLPEPNLEKGPPIFANVFAILTLILII